VRLSRQHEYAVIDRLVALAGSGPDAGLVLRGDPGIGKSVLLADTRQRVGGMLVLSATEAEAESALACATLHHLLRPVRHPASDLPALQRRALRMALGLKAGNADPGPFLDLAAQPDTSQQACVPAAGPVCCRRQRRVCRDHATSRGHISPASQ
jgi:hypothetical protein